MMENHANNSFGNTEILQIADAVAREKGIMRDSVIEAMEQAIQVAGRRKYGHEHTIRAEIDRKTGEIRLFRELLVVGDNEEKIEGEIEEGEDRIATISLRDAECMRSGIKIGDVISDPLPPIDLGRVAAQTAKQVIVQKVRDAERERQYEDFKDRTGDIIHGIVKRIEYGNVTVDLGRAEAILKRDSIIRGEVLRQNDRIRAYVEDVRRESKGAQIFLSRTHNKFIVKLFAQEVPEVYDGIIEIKAVAREPGSRAKMAVLSHDQSIDPIGSCVGLRGARVQAVTAELQGEKIDIINWSSDPATFVVNALAPAEVSKVVLDEEKKRIEVIVPEDQLSLAIGRRGQNVRLASQLTGWNIDVMTEDDESKRRVEEFNNVTHLFTEALNVEEVIAQLLVTEGFAAVEEVAYVPLEELASIEGFDEVIALELHNRATAYLEQQTGELKAKWHDLGVTEELAEFTGVSEEILVMFGENGIKSLEDLADLSHDEFIDIIPNSGLTGEQIDQLIMGARARTLEAVEGKNI